MLQHRFDWKNCSLWLPAAIAAVSRRSQAAGIQDAVRRYPTRRLERCGRDWLGLCEFPTSMWGLSVSTDGYPQNRPFGGANVVGVSPKMANTLDVATNLQETCHPSHVSVVQSVDEA